MVENKGEPGGGPFWVKNKELDLSLQIIEKAQINLDNPTQAEVLQKSTHFNPVLLLIAHKDAQDKKFDLTTYSDPDTAFITLHKSYGSIPITTYEHPGLWNGAMADWITLFVDVPIITFNPVKTINDLLRREHIN